MAYLFTVNNVYKDLQQGWSILESTNGSKTFRGAIKSIDGSYRPTLDQEVVLMEDHGTSTTSLLIGTGSKTFTTQASKRWLVGDRVRAYSAASSANYMEGAVTSYSGTTLIVSMDVTGGSGTKTDWNLTERLFGGHVNTPSEAGIVGGLTPIITTITATDFNAIAARRVMNLTGAVGAALKAALTSIAALLAGNGVTLYSAQVDGPAMPPLSYSFRRVDEILNDLSAMTGFLYTWEINYSKVLRMKVASAVAAPFNVTEGASGHAIGDITVEPSRQDYANRVLVLAGDGLREITETYVATSGQTVFPLAYSHVSNRGYITRAAVNEPIGVTTPPYWLIDAAAMTATRSSGCTVGDAVTIIYTAQFPVLVYATDAAYSTNPWEKLVREPEIFDVVQAQALATGYLAQAILTARTVKYTTLDNGIHPGQSQTITSTKRNLSGSYLVTDVTVQNDATSNLVRRMVTAVEGSTLVGSWKDTYRAMLGSSATSAGGGVVFIGSGSAGSGTVGKLAKWTTTSALGDSLLSESGSTVSLPGTFTAYRVYGSGNGDVPILGSTDISAIASFNSDNASGGYLRIQRSFTDIGYLGSAKSVIDASLSNDDFGLRSNGNLYLSAASNLTINPVGDVIFNPTGNDVYPLTNYDLSLGLATSKWLALYAGELRVDQLVAQDVISTIGGRITVAPTTTLSADLAAAGTTITVQHNEMANGDRIRMEKVGQVEWMAVTSSAGGSAGAYTYSVTRNLDGSGANDWIKGDAVVNTGTTGDGWIDLFARSGSTGPIILGYVRTGTTYNNWEERWVVGNLNGTFGYATELYGFACGVPSGAWVKIDPTNGVRIGYNTTTKIQLDSSGSASFSEGTVTINQTGITLATPGSSADYQYTYRFGSSFAANQIYGLTAFESGSTRHVVVANTTAVSGKTCLSHISAANDAIAVSMSLQASGSTASVTIAAHTIDCVLSGMTLGSPSGGNKGTGTLNATAVYDDNALLTDWVFDLWRDGVSGVAHAGRLYSIEETHEMALMSSRLPWMPSQDDFEQTRSLGRLVTGLWQGQEQQQIYLMDHEARLAALEAKVV